MDLLKQKIINNFLKLYPAIIIFIYFVCAALFITYPLIFHLSDFVSEPADGLYITWILNWNIHAFTNGIFNIFNANIFFPYHNTLAYSDVYITSAILAFLPMKIFAEPLVAYNFIFIFSLITFGFFTYLLTNYIIHDHLASVVSGTLVAFSSYTLTKPMHIQLLNIGCVPLAILFFIKFLDDKKYKYLFVASVFFIIQIYNSFLPGYFIVFSCLFILVYYYLKKKIAFKDFKLSKILIIAIVSFLFILPVIIPYYQVAKEFNYQRDIRDSIQYANRPEYILYPGFASKLEAPFKSIFYKFDKGPFTYDGFIGLGFFALTIFALLYRLKNRNKKWFFFDIFLVIGVFGFILSLGSAFQWGGHVIKHPFMIPLPYALFYYIIPGFNGLRNSARWEMLFLFSMSISIGIFLAIFYEKKSKILKYLLTVLICIVVLSEFKFPYVYYQIQTKENFPKAYIFINNLPKDSVISEFPIYNWGTFPPFNSENKREYYSTLGFWKTFNGGAGFNPPPWQQKATYLIKYFPSKESIRLLKDNQVSYIVVHGWEYNLLNLRRYNVDGKIVPNGNEVTTYLNSISDLKLIYSKDNDYVYEIK